MEVQVKVLDFMTKKIITILRDRNYQEAQNLMLGNDISSFPVNDSQSLLVGIITESDFVKK